MRLLLISSGCDIGEVREPVNSWWIQAANPEASSEEQSGSYRERHASWARVRCDGVAGRNRSTPV